MSVFPRKVCQDEYVIIHMNFKGIMPKNETIKYYVDVYNPEKKKILNIEKELFLRGNNKIYEKNTYYPIYIDNNFMPGNYLIDFYLLYDGKKIISSSKNTDFFTVEKVEYYKEKLNNKYNIILKNKSQEETTIHLYLESKTKTIKKEIVLSSLSEKRITTSCSKAYIEYGNNNFEIINDREKFK